MGCVLIHAGVCDGAGGTAAGLFPHIVWQCCFISYGTPAWKRHSSGAKVFICIDYRWNLFSFFPLSLHCFCNCIQTHLITRASFPGVTQWCWIVHASEKTSGCRLPKFCGSSKICPSVFALQDMLSLLSIFLYDRVCIPACRSAKLKVKMLFKLTAVQENPESSGQDINIHYQSMCICLLRWIHWASVETSHPPSNIKVNGQRLLRGDNVRIKAT